MGIGTKSGIMALAGAGGLFDTTSWALDGSDDYLVGTSYNTFAAHDDDTGTAKWTINLWVKFNSLSGTKYIYYISESGGTLVTYLYVNSTGRVQAFTTGEASNFTRANSAVTTGTWYMISVVFDSTLGRYSKQKLYINGAVPSGHTSNFDKADYNASGNIHLGTNYAENANIDGFINEPAIFIGYAASESELLGLYNSGVATNLNNHSTVPTNWFRSENAVWDGTDYTMTDEMGTGLTVKTENMDQVDRNTDVPS